MSLQQLWLTAHAWKQEGVDWEYTEYVYKMVKHYIQKVLEKEERRSQLYSQEIFMTKRRRMLQEHHLWGWPDPTHCSAKHLNTKSLKDVTLSIEPKGILLMQSTYELDFSSFISLYSAIQVFRGQLRSKGTKTPDSGSSGYVFHRAGSVSTQDAKLEVCGGFHPDFKGKPRKLRDWRESQEHSSRLLRGLCVKL